MRELRVEAGLNDLELRADRNDRAQRPMKTINGYGHLFPDSSATIVAKLDAGLDEDAPASLNLWPKKSSHGRANVGTYLHDTQSATEAVRLRIWPDKYGDIPNYNRT